MKKEEENEPLQSCRPAQILLVDDEDITRSVVSMLIQRLGHFVDEASSGKEALEFIRNNRYDLLITDVEMPEMNGWQLAAAIRGECNNMEIAILTGWGADAFGMEKGKYGVGYVLGKPIDLSKLKDLIETVLRSKK